MVTLNLLLARRPHGETGDDSHAMSVSVGRKYHDSQEAESFVPML